MSNRRWIFPVLMVVMLAIDQAVKAWVRGHLQVHESPGYPWPGVFEITLTYNQGVAFGMLQGFGVLLTPFAIGIGGYAGYYAWTHPQESPWNHTICGLLAAGAFGNLYDRLAQGKVTDMFWFRLINFHVFNVADACITIGTIMLMTNWLRESREKPEGPIGESPETQTVTGA